MTIIIVVLAADHKNNSMAVRIYLYHQQLAIHIQILSTAIQSYNKVVWLDLGLSYQDQGVSLHPVKPRLCSKHVINMPTDIVLLSANKTNALLAHTVLMHAGTSDMCQSDITTFKYSFFFNLISNVFCLFVYMYLFIFIFFLLFFYMHLYLFTCIYISF